MKTKMSADDDAVATSTTSTDREGREAIGKKRMSRKDRKEAKRLKKKDSADLPFLVSTPDENYLASYEPVNIPTQPSEEVSEASNSQKQSSKGKGNRKIDYDDEGGEGNCSATLGKWFPHALLIKCPVNYTNTGQLLLNSSHLSKEDVRMESPLASLVLFYQYSSAAAGKQWTPTQVKLLMTYLSTVARRRNLGGRIRVATEGVNATISAVDMPDLSAREALRHFAQDLKRFDPAVFDSVDFKYIDDLPADRHFKELRIIPVQELVFYDIRESDAPLQPDNQNASGSSGGIHLEAKEYHEMLKKENAVVIDVRNHYETIIGRFDGQESVGGARYIDPKMRKSTDFKGWLAKDETKEKLKNKTVLMFCTGGIRCERASAYLKNKLGNEVEEVYQVRLDQYLLSLNSLQAAQGKGVYASLLTLDFLFCISVHSWPVASNDIFRHIPVGEAFSKARTLCLTSANLLVRATRMAMVVLWSKLPTERNQPQSAVSAPVHGIDTLARKNAGRVVFQY